MYLCAKICALGGPTTVLEGGGAVPPHDIQVFADAMMIRVKPSFHKHMYRNELCISYDKFPRDLLLKLCPSLKVI